MYKLHTVERDLQILHRLWEPLTKNGNPNTTAWFISNCVVKVLQITKKKKNCKFTTGGRIRSLKLTVTLQVLF